MITTSHRAIVAMALALSAAAAFAHGDEARATARRFDPAKVEPTAFGQEGNPKKVTRTIQVDMTDGMRFTPAHITVKRGETVKFVVRNGGKLLHEMVLGTRQALEEHAELMKKFPEMEHDDPNSVRLAPGRSGEIIWKFTKSGTSTFACLIPGHYEAGMRGNIAIID